MGLLRNHISLFSADAVDQICEPLYKNTPITHFMYLRIYWDGSVMVLVNNPDYHRHFLEAGCVANISSDYLEGTHFISHLSEIPQLCSESRETYGIYQHIMRIYSLSEYLEGFGFATDYENKDNIIEYYLNHLDLLRQFENYFKDKAMKLIARADKERFKDYPKLEKNIIKKNSCVKNNKVSFKSKNYFVDTYNGLRKITFREYCCLKYLAYGYTLKESAIKQGIAPKTVESYLRNVKNKLSLSTRKELIDTFHKNFTEKI